MTTAAALYPYDDEAVPIVFDIGCSTAKAGFATESCPRVDYPSVVGRPFYQGVMIGMGRKDAYVGDEALSKRSILRGVYPIANKGEIANWDDLEKIYHHTFYNELRIAPEAQPLLVCDKYHECDTESMANTVQHRQKLTQIVFETFNAPAFCMASSAALSLFSHGITTGISVDSGHGQSNIIPVYEGHAHYYNRSTADAEADSADSDVLAPPLNCIQIGGHVLNQYLLKRFEFGVYLSANADAQYIKENVCKTARTPSELQSLRNMYLSENTGTNANASACSARSTTTTYVLPDQTEINMGFDAWNVCEFMFNPSLIIDDDQYWNTRRERTPRAPAPAPAPAWSKNKNKNKNKTKNTNTNTKRLWSPQILNAWDNLQLDTRLTEKRGIHELIYDTVMHCDADIRSHMSRNIVLCGGNTQFDGFHERLQHELNALNMSNSNSLSSSSSSVSLDFNIHGKPKPRTTANENIIAAKDANELSSSNGSASSTTDSNSSSFLLQARKTRKTRKAYEDRVIKQTDSRYSIWLGGSIYAALIRNESDLWLLKQEYDEIGPTSVFRKCF